MNLFIIFYLLHARSGSCQRYLDFAGNSRERELPFSSTNKLGIKRKHWIESKCIGKCTLKSTQYKLRTVSKSVSFFIFNKAIPDGGVAPHHLLRFRLSHMIWFKRTEKCKGFSKGRIARLCSGGSTYAPLARRSIRSVQKSISLVIFHLKLSKLFKLNIKC